ncbi:MAG: YfiR family protein [Kordiimonadaceae bacterium]|nr:YfiR family protein [Kordiimonadaceae bacterium]
MGILRYAAKSCHPLAAGLQAAILSSILMASAMADSSNRPQKETELKALILFQIPMLVTWDIKIARRAKEFRFCILQDPHLAAILAKQVAGERHQGRRMTVSLYEELTLDKECRIFYVAHDSAFFENDVDRVSALFDQMNDQGTLIVGSAADLLEKGGHINLQTYRNRIRLSVNRAATKNRHFKMSLRLERIGALRN